MCLHVMKCWLQQMTNVCVFECCLLGIHTHIETAIILIYTVHVCLELV